MKHWPEILSWSGIAGIAVGLYLVHPAAMFVGVGGVLLFLGVMANLKATRKDNPQ